MGVSGTNIDPELLAHLKRDALLAFVEKEGIEPTNHRAQREIRPAVIIRIMS